MILKSNEKLQNNKEYSNFEKIKNPILRKTRKRKRNVPDLKVSKKVNLKSSGQLQFNKEYSNLSQPGAFSSKILKYLNANETYSLHKQQRKKIKRRRIITSYPGQIMQMDLVEMRSIAKSNKNYNYILNVIDCFSKKLYSEKTKTKKGYEIAEKLKLILYRMDYSVQSLIFDEGKEFLNKQVGMLLKKMGIHWYHIKTTTKAGAVERVNKTVKSMIWKYFTENKTKKWINIIDAIVANYNNTYHTTIKMTPNEVRWKNRKQVFRNSFKKINAKIKCKLKVGDKVRVALKKKIFEKSFVINWSNDIFTIKRAFQRGGVCWYSIIDKDGVIYPKYKYYYQLNLVS